MQELQLKMLFQHLQSSFVTNHTNLYIEKDDAKGVILKPCSALSFRFQLWHTLREEVLPFS